MPTFAHSGLNGDLVYALAAVKALGGGDVLLYFDPRAEESFTPSRAANIVPLLEAQPYVRSARFAHRLPPGVDHDFARWRHTYRPPENLARAQCRAVGAPASACDAPWLTVDPNPVARVVVCRSFRYRDPSFPWWALAAKYGREAVVVGTPAEYEDLRQFGFNRYFPTPNLLEAARVVAGAELVIANQTCVRAIAEGLKKRVAMEESPNVPNCRFDRDGEYVGDAVGELL